MELVIEKYKFIVTRARPCGLVLNVVKGCGDLPGLHRARQVRVLKKQSVCPSP